ncbi:hypothetical protein GCM10023310_60720 [Paenibacillus vulneris]
MTVTGEAKAVIGAVKEATGEAKAVTGAVKEATGEAKAVIGAVKAVTGEAKAVMAATEASGAAIAVKGTGLARIATTKSKLPISMAA